MKVEIAKSILNNINASNKSIHRALWIAQKNVAIDDPDFYVLMRTIVGENLGNEMEVLEAIFLEHPKLQPKWRREPLPKLSKKEIERRRRKSRFEHNTLMANRYFVQLWKAAESLSKSSILRNSKEKDVIRKLRIDLSALKRQVAAVLKENINISKELTKLKGPSHLSIIKLKASGNWAYSASKGKLLTRMFKKRIPNSSKIES
jgi:hypothetical protein